MTTPQHAAVQRAEEDAHVASELEAAGVGQAPSLADLRRELEEKGGSVGGVVSSAEMLPIYNRYDGVLSEITTDQASQRLRVRFGSEHPWAGQLVWTTKEPETGSVVGTLLCPLHAESDMRDYLNVLGVSLTCRKSNMKLQDDVDAHFEHKHNRIFRAVERDKAKQLENQRMDLMREQTEAMREMAAAQRDAPAKKEKVSA
jgi:hypothetical protein